MKMNREIKFRAWNETKKKYHYSNEDSNYWWDNINFGAVELINQTLNGNFSPSWDSLFYEQYTGLTDKNGKEIYEGDIVELDAGYRVFNELVQYDKQGFYPFADCIGGYVDDGLVKALTENNYKVIGNIHQHKHLLED